jgi:hypothetical protein
MKTTEAKLLSFLHKAPDLVVPSYQRTYSWIESCRKSSDDTRRLELTLTSMMELPYLTCLAGGWRNLHMGAGWQS